MAERITGKKQYCCYGAVNTGTPGSDADVLFGLTTGGGPKGASALDFDKGIGGAWDAAGGALEGFECGVDFQLSDGAFAGSAYVHRPRGEGDGFPASVMTPFDLVAGSVLEYVYPSCYLDTLDLTFAIGKALATSIRVLPTGLPFTQARQARTWSNTLAKCYRWHHVALTINGAALVCQSAKVSLKNNLQYDTSLDGGRTAGAKRFPEGVLIGDEEVEVSGSVRDEMAWAGLTADDLAAGASFVGVATHPVTNKVLTVNLPALYRADNSAGFQGDGGPTSSDFTFRAGPNSLGAWLTEA